MPKNKEEHKMEASIATERGRENRSERFMSAGSELAGLAMERAHRAAQAAREVGPVITKGAAEALGDESDARYEYFRAIAINGDMRDMGV
jgi:hypothetical protein